MRKIFFICFFVLFLLNAVSAYDTSFFGNTSDTYLFEIPVELSFFGTVSETYFFEIRNYQYPYFGNTSDTYLFTIQSSISDFNFLLYNSSSELIKKLTETYGYFASESELIKKIIQTESSKLDLIQYSDRNLFYQRLSN